MWGAVAGILGVSVVLACADVLVREFWNRPPPPERIEDRQAASRPERSRPNTYSGPARDVLNRVKRMSRK